MNNSLDTYFLIRVYNYYNRRNQRKLLRTFGPYLSYEEATEIMVNHVPSLTMEDAVEIDLTIILEEAYYDGLRNEWQAVDEKIQLDATRE